MLKILKLLKYKQGRTFKIPIQGEHKNTPRFQVVVKSKLTGILHFTALWRRAGKLKIS
jgi:hypothetical protein